MKLSTFVFSCYPFVQLNSFFRPYLSQQTPSAWLGSKWPALTSPPLSLYFTLAISFLLQHNAFPQTDSSYYTINTSGFFKTSRFCQPFVSELENYRPQVALHYASNHEEYDVSRSQKSHKVFQYTAAGFEIPLYRKYVYAGDRVRYTFAFSSAMAMHLWWDPFEMSSSPILSTDYRVNSIIFKYIYFLKSKYIKNISLKLAPFNHESTHIGDDLTIYRISRNYPITRVNVSYEYSDLALSLNDPAGLIEQNHSLRIGWMYRLNGKEDYYSVTENEGDPALVQATGLHSEYYLQYNLIRSRGWLTWKRWKNICSIELRNRVRYQYPEFNSKGSGIDLVYPDSKRNYSLNLFWGYKFVNYKGPTPGIYLTAYSGLNPYGQFRNKARFQSVGITVVLE